MNTAKIEKIKKMLALANGTNFEGEAEQALAMANKLMSEEGLTMEEIAKTSIEDELGELGSEYLNNGEEKAYQPWRRTLLNALCRMFDCSFVNNKKAGTTKFTIDLIGRESNRVTVQLMYNWIADRTLKEAREKFGKMTAKRNSYCNGVANAIWDKVCQMKPNPKTDKNAWGIVPIDEVENFKHSKYPCLRTTSNRATISDGSAYASGVEAGKNTSLNKQFGIKMIA